MIPRDAEDAVKLWLHFRSGGDQVRSLNLYETREVCARCGKGPQTYQGRDRLAVCMACRQPWQGRTTVLVELHPSHAPERCAACDSTRKGKRGQFRGLCLGCGAEWRPALDAIAVGGTLSPRVRRDLLTLEKIADALVVLRRAIEPRPRNWTLREWDFDLRAFALTIEGDGMSPATAAVEGAGLWPELEGKTRWWSEFKVRESAKLARAVIERRLDAAITERRGGRRGRRGVDDWGDESPWRPLPDGSGGVRRPCAA